MTFHSPAIFDLADVAAAMENDAFNGDVLALARHVAQANTLLVAIATECVERGIREGKTQRALAQALDVPERALRGARQEFA